jgi:hypothetical protein
MKRFIFIRVRLIKFTDLCGFFLRFALEAPPQVHSHDPENEHLDPEVPKVAPAVINQDVAGEHQP